MISEIRSGVSVHRKSDKIAISVTICRMISDQGTKTVRASAILSPLRYFANRISSEEDIGVDLDIGPWVPTIVSLDQSLVG